MYKLLCDPGLTGRLRLLARTPNPAPPGWYVLVSRYVKSPRRARANERRNTRISRASPRSGSSFLFAVQLTAPIRPDDRQSSGGMNAFEPLEPHSSAGASTSETSSSSSATPQPIMTPTTRSLDEFLESVYASRPRFGISKLYYAIIFFALGLANSGDSAEMGCTNYILSSKTFQDDILKNGDDVDFANRGAAIAGAHFLGMLISGLISGVLADIYGRRSTLLVGLCANSIFGLAAAASRNAVELAILRFFTGIAVGAVIAGVVTLSAEIAPPSRRGRFMTLVASCYTLGFLYTAAWAVVIFRGDEGSWRYSDLNGRLFMVINAFPTILAAFLVSVFVPESPRFYLGRGRLEEAVNVCNTLASRLNYDRSSYLSEDELRRYLFRTKEIGRMSTLGKHAIESSSVGETRLGEIWASLLNMKTVYVRGMWKSTLPLQCCYMSLTVVTGVATWWTKIFQSLHLQTDAYKLSFYHTLSQIPGMFMASGLIDSVGRRRLVIYGFTGGSTTLILLSSLVQTVIATEATGNDNHFSILVLGLACFYSICLCIGWLSLDCLSSETYPTKIRSTGRGVCVASGR
ncbi:hypothetical protein THAOC_32475 [Thalassiosira oceanica]|uniref:Major facilitator superfamily (MFS) profile domain-containing protein n=1 Tax=Thalassiosira oceanica TaxID=159749 RepID=K0R777_THAOC|nr:hypothetical protein THAOC_32475 [Thalassiosira oceanica]|eukprot:EJK48705.1 hypothetical protein THAOC_32475 [Thalassiosira oceanica]